MTKWPPNCAFLLNHWITDTYKPLFPFSSWPEYSFYPINRWKLPLNPYIDWVSLLFWERLRERLRVGASAGMGEPCSGNRRSRFASRRMGWGVGFISWKGWHFSWKGWHLSWKSWHFREIVDNSLNFILSKSLNYEELFVSLYSKKC